MLISLGLLLIQSSWAGSNESVSVESRSKGRSPAIVGEIHYDESTSEREPASVSNLEIKPEFNTDVTPHGEENLLGEAK